MKTDKELRKIAKQIHEGAIFISTTNDEIYQCFPVLYVADPNQLPREIGAVYEFYEKAMPRMVNSKPMFFSANFLNVKEAQKVIFYVKEIQSLLSAFDDDDTEEEKIEVTEEEIEGMLQELLGQLIDQGAIKVVEEEEEEITEEEISTVFDSIKRGLEEAVEYEQGKIPAKTQKVSKRRKKTTIKKEKK